MKPLEYQCKNDGKYGYIKILEIDWGSMKPFEIWWKNNEKAVET